MIYEYQRVKEVPCDGPWCSIKTKTPIKADGHQFCSGHCHENWKRNRRKTFNLQQGDRWGA